MSASSAPAPTVAFDAAAAPLDADLPAPLDAARTAEHNGAADADVGAVKTALTAGRNRDSIVRRYLG